MTTLTEMITEAERKYDSVSEESDFKADYALGRLRGLQQATLAETTRLTDAETAVIDAALDVMFHGSPRLAKAVAALEAERGQRSEAIAQRMIADGIPCDDACPYGGTGPDCTPRAGCDDCGSDLHSTDSYHCPVKMQDDDGRD